MNRFMIFSTLILMLLPSAARAQGVEPYLDRLPPNTLATVAFEPSKLEAICNGMGTLDGRISGSFVPIPSPLTQPIIGALFRVELLPGTRCGAQRLGGFEATTKLIDQTRPVMVAYSAIALHPDAFLEPSDFVDAGLSFGVRVFVPTENPQKLRTLFDSICKRVGENCEIRRTTAQNGHVELDAVIEKSRDDVTSLWPDDATDSAFFDVSSSAQQTFRASDSMVRVFVKHNGLRRLLAFGKGHGWMSDRIFTLGDSRVAEAAEMALEFQPGREGGLQLDVTQSLTPYGIALHRAQSGVALPYLEDADFVAVLAFNWATVGKVVRPHPAIEPDPKSGRVSYDLSGAGWRNSTIDMRDAAMDAPFILLAAPNSTAWALSQLSIPGADGMSLSLATPPFSDSVTTFELALPGRHEAEDLIAIAPLVPGIGPTLSEDSEGWNQGDDRLVLRHGTPGKSSAKLAPGELLRISRDVARMKAAAALRVEGVARPRPAGEQLITRALCGAVEECAWALRSNRGPLEPYLSGKRSFGISVVSKGNTRVIRLALGTGIEDAPEAVSGETPEFVPLDPCIEEANVAVMHRYRMQIGTFHSVIGQELSGLTRFGQSSQVEPVKTLREKLRSDTRAAWESLLLDLREAAKGCETPEGKSRLRKAQAAWKAWDPDKDEWLLRRLPSVD